MILQGVFEKFSCFSKYEHFVNISKNYCFFEFTLYNNCITELCDGGADLISNPGKCRQARAKGRSAEAKRTPFRFAGLQEKILQTVTLCGGPSFTKNRRKCVLHVYGCIIIWERKQKP